MVSVKYPYVYEDVDRHGNVRLYFWRKGQRKVRIRERPGSDEFAAQYRVLLDASETGGPRRSAASNLLEHRNGDGCVPNTSGLQSSVASKQRRKSHDAEFWNRPSTSRSIQGPPRRLRAFP